MENHATVREKLGWLVGRRVIDVTQQDEDEFLETREAYVMIMFDDGSTLKFPLCERPVVEERYPCRG
jgi:hypothetical protein